MDNKLSKAYKILKEQKANDFKRFYDLGHQAESLYGCCGQCVTYPFVKILDADPSLFKYASGFCAGVGHLGQYPCGAFNGGVLVLSYFFGREVAGLANEENEADRDFFRNTCRLVREYEQRYISVFGDVICRKVQTKIFGRSFNVLDEEDYAVFEDMGAHKDKCTNVVGTGAKIVAQLIFEELDRLKNLK